MRIAVANSDFEVAIVDKNTQVPKRYQIANGEVLKFASGRITGVVKPDFIHGKGAIAGYLVEIEGQTVFVDEDLLEVSK